MSPVAREHLGDEIDLLHQPRASPINWTPYGGFRVRCNARSATLADGGQEAIRIVLTEVTTVAHSTSRLVDWLVRTTGAPAGSACRQAVFCSKSRFRALKSRATHSASRSKSSSDMPGRRETENTTSVPFPFGNARIGLCIAAPSSGVTEWSRTPKRFCSVKRTVIRPMGFSASHSMPPRWRNEWPRPEAHFGKFAGSARNAYTSSNGREMPMLMWRTEFGIDLGRGSRDQCESDRDGLLGFFQAAP